MELDKLNHIGERLLLLRQEQVATQNQIAEATKIQIKTYRSIEQGRTFGRVDTLVILAEYFGVSLDYLVCGKNDSINKLLFLLTDLEEGKQESIYRILKVVIDEMKCYKIGH